MGVRNGGVGGDFKAIKKTPPLLLFYGPGNFLSEDLDSEPKNAPSALAGNPPIV